MSHNLDCEMSIESKKNTVYWWPLVFEAMQRSSFRFTAPDQQEGTGYYYYVRIGDETDTDFVTASFRTLWDEIYSETSELLISFWHTDQEPLPLDISLRQERGKALVHVLLSLNEAYILDVPMELVKTRLYLVLNCAKSLYEICRPCTGEMFWTGTNAPLASFGKPLITPLLSHAKQGGHQMRLVEQPLGEEEKMYLVDPVPVRIRGGYDFVSFS